MANEGSTKPTEVSQVIEGSRNYWKRRAETAETSLARVRGLLQRLVGAVKELEGTPIEYRLGMELANILKAAESADIGKLDTADKSGVEMGKVNRVESEVRRLLEMAETPCERPRQRFYDFLRERDAWQEGDRNLDYGELILKCIKATQAGSAETGGEKADHD